MRRVLVTIILGIALLMGLLAGCAKPAETPAQEPIRIGVIGDMTSWASVTDMKTFPGIQFAAKEAGLINGRPVEVIFEDHGANPQQGLEKARKLVERDKIKILVGPQVSGVAVAVAPYLTKNGVPDIPTYAYHPELMKQDYWYFAPIGVSSMIGYGSGVFAAEVLGAKTAAILGPDFEGSRDYLKGFQIAFEERGGKVIQQQWYPTDVVDFSQFILNIDDNADVTAAIAWGATGPTFFTQYHQLIPEGERPIVNIWDEFDLLDYQRLDTIPAKIPVYSSSAFTFKSDQAQKDWVAKYTQIVGSPPLMNAPNFLGYYAALIAIEALKITGGESGEALYKALQTMDIDTPHGRVNFTDRIMDAFIEVRKAEEKNGAFVMVPQMRYRTHGEWNTGKTEIIHTLVFGEKAQ